MWQELLLRPKFLQVFERAKTYKECGAGISLDINGLKSLQAIDPILCEDFQRSVCSIQTGKMTDRQGVGMDAFCSYNCWSALCPSQEQNMIPVLDFGPGNDSSRTQTQGMRSNAQRYMDDYGIRTGLIGWYEIIQVGISHPLNGCLCASSFTSGCLRAGSL